MKGEIYDLHNRQLSLVRDIQKYNPNLILGGALGLKVQGIKIPDKWYDIFFYTNDLYKIKGERRENSNFYWQGNYWNKQSQITDEKYATPVKVYQKKESDIDSKYIKYLGFSYRVVHPIMILTQYVHLSIMYRVGLVEFRTAMEARTIETDSNLWTSKYPQYSRW